MRDEKLHPAVARRWAKHISKSKCKSASRPEQFWQWTQSKSARGCGAKHIIFPSQNGKSTLQLPQPMQLVHYNYNYTPHTRHCTILHHTTSSSCGWGDHCNRSKKYAYNSNHIRSISGFSLPSMHHNNQTSPIGFLSLKLRPPPCAVPVLLVLITIHGNVTALCADSGGDQTVWNPLLFCQQFVRKCSIWSHQNNLEPVFTWSTRYSLGVAFF